MARGRKPDPRTLRIVKGNLQRRPLPPPSPVASGDVTAPEWLAEDAKGIFGTLVARLSEVGLASPSHVEMLALAALRLAEVQRYTAKLEAEGATYITRSTVGAKLHKARPEVALRNEAIRHAQSLLAEFGLSPSSATRVAPGTAKPRENKFAGIGASGA